jgi:hypothetical protein
MFLETIHVTNVLELSLPWTVLGYYHVVFFLGGGGKLMRGL